MDPDIHKRKDEEPSSSTLQSQQGADQSVTNLVAIKGRCPRREILVTWKQPATPPQGYKLKFYSVKEKNSTQLVQSVTTLEPTQVSQRFVELRSSTTYICEVIPRYDREPEVGSFSNLEVTDERVASDTETLNDFGQPEHFMHMENLGHNNDLIIELSWRKINIGENYRITGYHVNVFHSGHAFFTSNLPAITTHVDVPNLQKGQKYDVKFTTEYIDLDDRTKEIKTTKTHSFCTTPTFITNCELQNGVITISWECVYRAGQHRIVIKDEHLSKNIAEDEVITGNESQVKIQTTEKLCIGRTCMIKIFNSWNNLIAESEWKTYLIGGKLVPRNVEARRNSDNPNRSILVTFDAPKQGPVKEYKIVVVPESGKRKTFLHSSTVFLAEYLRKGIKYKFHVFAKHGEEWSDASISNSQETDGGDSHMTKNPGMSSQNISFNLHGAQSTGITAPVNVNTKDNFGKVRDLTLVPVEEKQPNKQETLKLSWEVPLFDNNAFDYKVKKYKFEIKKKDFSLKTYLKFEKYKDKYCTLNQLLELGETYDISVSTIYIDIDQDDEHISNAAEKKVHTRPCEPNGIKCNVQKKDSGEEYLKIEWNSAKGAKYYKVEIHTDKYETQEPLFKHNVELTEWQRVFDDKFGFGTSYHAVITAIGDENKSNFQRTDRETIGGDFAPKKVQASITHIRVVDPNTQVYLSWEPPAQQLQSYEVTYENEGTQIILCCSESEILITGLKVGTCYDFNVVSIHEQQKRKSEGCVSNRIDTTSTPTQVHTHVHTFPGHNPSTSINISWDNVDAEKKEESTKYRVNVLSLDEMIRKVIYVTNTHVTVDGLLPGTKYFTTVAGGNSMEFGNDSIKHAFQTELGTPKNVYLLNNSTSPHTSLKLQFSEAEGKPINYLGAFIKYENQGKHEDLAYIDVQPGHTFNNLDPNTIYSARVLAVFENGKEGKAVISEVVRTAPSKPVINESGCCTDNKIKSSKDLFLKWTSDSGCREHEIILKHGDKVENQQIIQNKTELRYSCIHESSRYTAQIRTKNDIFGQWSDEAVIDLAPAKLKNVQAKLDQRSNNIFIQCKKEAKDSLSYFCQALCSDKSSGEPVMVQPHDNEDENIVKFIFMPTLYAEKYFFKLWAEDDKDGMGESMLTEYLISRPASGKITQVENIGKNPCSDIEITWDALERCDEYEVKIIKNSEQTVETCARSTKTSLKYRCEYPGVQYSVRVRGIRESIYGNWSEKVSIILAPGQVELIEDENAQEPVESVQVKWRELKTKPEGYRVILYNEIKVEIASETETEFTHHVFEKLAKPGSLCYYTVAAYNTTGEGKVTKSQNYRISETKVAFNECKQIEQNKKVNENKGNQEWTSIEEWTAFSIKYDKKSCCRKGSKVFNARRESGGEKEEIIVKFVTDFSLVNIREIDSLWATIGHENVVKYLQSGFCKFEDAKSIFIAMEKCEKDTLYEKIEASQNPKAKRVSYKGRKTTVYDIAKGMQHLKEKGILHRDLKPQNILYRGSVTVISDFGLSKRISPNKSNTQQSVSKVGTNGWRAPETSMKKGICTFAGDIYAAGLVNFYALTNGKHPFGENSEHWQTFIDTGCVKRNLKALEEIGEFDWTLAFDMIDLMLRRDPKLRPTVAAILENPLFWPADKILEFVSKTNDFIKQNQKQNQNSSTSEITSICELNKREGKYGSQIHDEMKNWTHQSGKEGGKNWKDLSGEHGDKNWKEKLFFTYDEMQMIRENFYKKNVHAVVDIDAMGRKAKTYKDSVTELLRFIRNRYAHINDDNEEGTINQSEEQLSKYFFDRFPHLFIYVYCKIKDHYYDEKKSCTDILAKYFPLSQPNIIRNEVKNDSVEIEWEPVICAHHYKLEIYTNNSRQKEPVLTKDVGKETEWTQAFDDKFGYGTSYYAVVTAIGDGAVVGHGNKRSSTCTDQKQIGK